MSDCSCQPPTGMKLAGGVISYNPNNDELKDSFAASCKCPSLSKIIQKFDCATIKNYSQISDSLNSIYDFFVFDKKNANVIVSLAFNGYIDDKYKTKATWTTIIFDLRDKQSFHTCDIPE